jgi:vancomycin resistance protein YoaR
MYTFAIQSRLVSYHSTMNEPTVLNTAVQEALRPPRRRRSRLVEWTLVLLALAALLLVLGTIGLLFGERDFYDRVYPNIAVRGVPIGGDDLAAAHTTLAQHYGPFLTSPVEIVYGGRSWHPGAADLGLTIALDEAVEQAHAIGRGSTRNENLRTIRAVWLQGIDLPLRVSVDQVAIQQYLLQIAPIVEQPPRNADLRLDNGQILLTQESWGTQALIDETVQDITAALQTMTPLRVELRTRSLEPQVRDDDLAPTAAMLRTMLAGPIALSNEDGQRWEWSVPQLGSWLQLRSLERNGRPAMEVLVDRTAIRNTLVPIAAAIKVDGALPRVAWNGGQLTIVEPGTNGTGLDANQALALVDAALAGGPREISLPRKAIPPPVTQDNLSSLGIIEPVGSGVSSFARSEQYRITNIRAGARRMDGILLPPGASFSFNDNLGPVDAANGFVEGLAIVDNRTQKEWGGGLCQVSTTVFRAAFWGGLEITERHEHSFRIGWYEELGEPPGLDAAIFTGVQDMRFVNDTQSWLLMESNVDLERQRLTITLYGSPTGRSVALDHRVIERMPKPSEPVYVDDPELPAGTVKRTDIARDGIKVEVYRVVREAERVIANDTFATTFKPWPDIYVRGTQ